MAVTIEVYHQAEQWHVRRQGEREPLSNHAKKDSHGHDPRNVPG